MTKWIDIKEAPKESEGKSEEHGFGYCGPWILGVNKHGEQRVIRWTTEYPCREGVWMYAYAPTDYIDSIIELFAPTHFKYLDDGPD